MTNTIVVLAQFIHCQEQLWKGVADFFQWPEFPLPCVRAGEQIGYLYIQGFVLPGGNKVYFVVVYKSGGMRPSPKLSNGGNRF